MNKKSGANIHPGLIPAIGLSLLLAAGSTRASVAYGSINNFDTVNDTEHECHGFEIKDYHSTDITYTYNYNRYGVPNIAQDDSVAGHPKCLIRWESKKNPDGSWAAYTAIPSGPVSPTDKWGDTRTYPLVKVTARDSTAMATLLGTDADTSVLSYRIVEPPKHGTLSIAGDQVAYTPHPGFAGTDVFNYCAMDNRTDSNLATVSINVGAGANTADNDQDGVPDLVERAFGLSTSRRNRGTAPDYQIHDDDDGNLTIQAVYNPRLIPPDLEPVFEASSDLGAWDPNAPNLSTSTNARPAAVRSRLSPRPNHRKGATLPLPTATSDVAPSTGQSSPARGPMKRILAAAR